MLEIFNVLAEYTCGNLDKAFDGKIPELTSLIVTLIQIGVPILLIIFGMLDLGKSVMAQKEDEIKAGQKTFLKRLLAAVIVFFVVVVVKIVVGLASDDENITDCIDCFISGPESCTAQ